MAKDQNPASIPTSALMKKLFKTAGLKSFMDDYEGVFLTGDFCARLKQLCADRQISCAQVIRSCGIDRTYGYQLFSGVRQPSRDKVIQLAFGFPLCVEETQELLRVAGKSPLYPKIKRDAAILYCLRHRMDFCEAQATLQELSLPLIGREGSYE
ncbi:MAG: helix-turn-helix transcriptional regulator [Bacillota bacterium]